MSRRWKLTLVLVAVLALPSSATVTINATFLDQQGNPVPYAFLEVQIVNCGYNIPSVPGQPASIVLKDQKFKPSQLPVSIFGNNEITCGNSYSTLYHITAWADANTKLAGDYNYDLCSSLTNCLGAATPSWNLAQSQPFVGSPPPPGFGALFTNPVQSQYWNQPAGTTGYFVGAFDFTRATVTGLPGGGGSPATTVTGTPTEIVATPGPTNSVTLSFDSPTMFPGAATIPGPMTVGPVVGTPAGVPALLFSDSDPFGTCNNLNWDQLGDVNDVNSAGGGSAYWNANCGGAGTTDERIFRTQFSPTPYPDGTIWVWNQALLIAIPAPGANLSSITGALTVPSAVVNGAITATGPITGPSSATSTVGGVINGATLAPQSSRRTATVSAFLPPAVGFNATGGGASFGLAARQWVTGTNYYGATGLTGHGDWVSNGGRTYWNAGATGVSGASAPTCSSGMCTDGTITWTEVSGCTNQCAIDDYWNYAVAVHDAAGNVLACNIDRPGYGESDWSAIDSGTSGPNFTFTNPDAWFTLFLNDPTYQACIYSKLEYGVKPIDGNAANSYAAGNSGTPAYIFTQTYANGLFALNSANATALTWSTNGLLATGTYWYGWWINDGTTNCSGGPCYWKVTSTGANAVCTPSTTPPASWTSPQTDGTCTWTKIGANPPLQDAGVDSTWVDCSGYSAGSCVTGGNTKLAVTCGGYNGSTFSSAGYFNTSSGCAPASTDLATGFPAPWEPAYFLTVTNSLYPAVVNHYAHNSAWTGKMGEISFGQTKGAQNNYFTSALIAGASLTNTGSSTGVQFGTFWGTVMQAYAQQMGALQDTASTVLGFTLTAPNNPTIGTLEAQACKINALACGDFGETATDATSGYPTGCSDNWCMLIPQVASYVPETDLEMLNTSTCGGGTSGALIVNMQFAQTLGANNFKVLPRDYMAMSPNSSIYNTCGPGVTGPNNLLAIENFHQGLSQNSSSAKPMVDPVGGGPVLAPLGVVISTAGFNFMIPSNAAGGGGVPALSAAGIDTNVNLGLNGKGTGVVVPNGLAFTTQFTPQSAPVISSGCGTSPSVSDWNGPKFLITIGSSPGAACVVHIAAPSPTHGWDVRCHDITTTAATMLQNAFTTTSATFALASTVAADTMLCSAEGF